MAYKLRTTFEAIQFTDGALPQIKDFIERVASTEHLSFKQEGVNAVHFWGRDFDRYLQPGEWVVAMDGTVWFVTERWFRDNCTSVE